MRILFMTALYQPYVTGGAERSVEQLAKELIRLGHDVGVVTLSPDVPSEDVIEGVSVFRIPHGNPFWTLDVDQQPRFKRSWSKLSQAWNKTVAATTEAYERICAAKNLNNQEDAVHS